MSPDNFIILFVNFMILCLGLVLAFLSIVSGHEWWAIVFLVAAFFVRARR